MADLSFAVAPITRDLINRAISENREAVRAHIDAEVANGRNVRDVVLEMIDGLMVPEDR